MIRSNHEKFPFTLYDEALLKNIANADSMRILETLPTFEILSKILNFANLNTNDIDANLNTNINCKYYQVDEFQKTQTKKGKNLNIYHANANGLESHFDNLHDFLSRLPTDFDVINITETSEQFDGFKSNVSLEGYDTYFTPTNSAKGGTGIYVKSNIDADNRPDLSIENNDFESVWIEIKNTKSKNIVCGCIYRHPRVDFEEFLKYLEKCLRVLSKEGKDVYISGDFNIDLLKLDRNESY